jgi:hypothetical protein
VPPNRTACRHRAGQKRRDTNPPVSGVPRRRPVPSPPFYRDQGPTAGLGARAFRLGVTREQGDPTLASAYPPGRCASLKSHRTYVAPGSPGVDPCRPAHRVLERARNARARTDISSLSAQEIAAAFTATRERAISLCTLARKSSRSFRGTLGVAPNPGRRGFLPAVAHSAERSRGNPTPAQATPLAKLHAAHSAWRLARSSVPPNNACRHRAGQKAVRVIHRGLDSSWPEVRTVTTLTRRSSVVTTSKEGAPGAAVHGHSQVRGRDAVR